MTIGCIDNNRQYIRQEGSLNLAQNDKEADCLESASFDSAKDNERARYGDRGSVDPKIINDGNAGCADQGSTDLAKNDRLAGTLKLEQVETTFSRILRLSRGRSGKVLENLWPNILTIGINASNCHSYLLKRNRHLNDSGSCRGCLESPIYPPTQGLNDQNRLVVRISLFPGRQKTQIVSRLLLQSEIFSLKAIYFGARHAPLFFHKTLCPVVKGIQQKKEAVSQCIDELLMDEIMQQISLEANNDSKVSKMEDRFKIKSVINDIPQIQEDNSNVGLVEKDSTVQTICESQFMTLTYDSWTTRQDCLSLPSTNGGPELAFTTLVAYPSHVSSELCEYKKKRRQVEVKRTDAYSEKILPSGRDTLNAPRGHKDEQLFKLILSKRQFTSEAIDRVIEGCRIIWRRHCQRIGEFEEFQLTSSKILEIQMTVKDQEMMKSNFLAQQGQFQSTDSNTNASWTAIGMQLKIQGFLEKEIYEFKSIGLEQLETRIALDNWTQKFRRVMIMTRL
ncbi:MAG: hypothetical protein EZS28_035187 [Streblomastix strix]|uniref:Uncharacterized protein n=1 Tax=Streblomastix strix TaxID=222440 RepID=A0A5J4UEU0_9EUKA|nr:MAG: hypothetical protein EZS28_035187 [Streblomastix strix]